MHWLQSLDDGLLGFINQTLSNPVFDAVMPFASGNRYFFPALFVAGLLLIWKGGVRARLCALMLALILWPGDSLVCNTIKHAVARPRPFVTHSDVLLPSKKVKADAAGGGGEIRTEINGGAPAGKPNYNSMPSSHAANWFAATMILLVYYRRSWRFMLPLACLVSFSRVYNGVHYPSDVLAGAILGAGYAAAAMWAFNALWQWAGRKWLPLWWEKSPSLVAPEVSGFGVTVPSPTAQAPPATQTAAESPIANRQSPISDSQSPIANPQSPISDIQSSTANRQSPISDSQSPIADRQLAIGYRLSAIDRHWLRLGYVFIAVLFLARLAYIGSDVIELSQDEAYQWVWSKHLALSYYSKPPLIAYTQFLGTHLWGDNEFGVRFFSPVLAALMSLSLLRFMARLVNSRAAFVLLLIAATTPLLGVGSTLMTVDPLSVAFWVFAMIAGWRAVQPDSTTVDWLWTGLWMGLGFLSKYTELLQWLSWVVFFIVWQPARRQLRRPGPYLALGINALCALPVLIWNFQNHWITISHVAANAGLNGTSNAWRPQVFSFLGAELALLNPVYFVAAIWAAIAFWRSLRGQASAVYLFSMGAPLFLCYLLWSFHSAIKPNWIAPSVPPLFCLMVVYWHHRWKEIARWGRAALTAGLVFGAAVVAVLHDTDLIGKVAGKPLPPKPDPLTRVRAWKDSALLVEAARQKLEAEGKPAFIICNHYGTTGLLTFYLPAAKTNVTGKFLVYCLTSDAPENQFYFWPGYRQERKGENAVFVRELLAPRLVEGWFFKWLRGEKNLLRHPPRSGRPPPELLEEFASVTSLGQFNVLYHGRVYHTYQIFECRDLR